MRRPQCSCILSEQRQHHRRVSQAAQHFQRFPALRLTAAGIVHLADPVYNRFPADDAADPFRPLKLKRREAGNVRAAFAANFINLHNAVVIIN